jgi:hypothetical protein
MHAAALLLLGLAVKVSARGIGGFIGGLIDDFVSEGAEEASNEAGFPVWAIIIIVVITSVCGPCCILAACRKARENHSLPAIGAQRV